MDSEKKVNLLKQSNQELTERLKELTIEIDANKSISKEQQKSVDDLIRDVTAIRETYLDLIDELHGYKHKYEKLIGEVKVLKLKLSKEIKQQKTVLKKLQKI